jgi:alkanesulfonate monooxygenase SsuD/methylene tetrahydromethanopterin reductase-like flavin-dependent oxidoreductase (luciferase family)
MDVGIGLPNAVPGVQRDGIVDFAQRAEKAGFSSLGTIDRIAYANYEGMTVLSAAAAVTEKIGLLTDILIAPLRSNTALLAKQTATLDSLSEGRLTLGLAPGGRDDDYDVSEVDFSTRGKVFDAQLSELTSHWAGDTKVGPPPHDGRPGVLIGGSSDKALHRAAKYGDGFTMGGGTPDQMKETVPKLKEIWEAEGREGEPRKIALCYFALGDGGKEAAREELGEYYAWLGDEIAGQIADSAVVNADMAKGYIDAFTDAGADELIFFPCIADPAQVDLLADAALS